jgi:hypothetical protein
MCFSAVELTIAFPLGLYQLLADANKVIFPWISWEDTHSHFDRYDQLPAIFIERHPASSLQFSVLIWSIPILAYIFFLFFGLCREQRIQYKRWFYALLKPFGIKTPAPAPNPYNRNSNSDHNRHRNRNSRTWWQKLLRRPAHSSHGNGPTDPLPSYPDKPIPSARSRVLQTASLDASLAFDFDDSLDIESNISGPDHPEGMLDVDAGVDVDLNKALPASPSIVRTRSRSPVSTSSASSVAGSSRKVDAAICDVELSETAVRAMEARVHQMA